MRIGDDLQLADAVTHARARAHTQTSARARIHVRTHMHPPPVLQVSIFSLLQAKGVDSFVVITDSTSSSQIKKVVADLAKKSWCVGIPFTMPVADE